ncbi:LysR family transcriptional regulator [Burkholderia sp. Bp9031]|uniref:LysR family transcriptional regulator n=1 Tax=Burkholderia sp. Bp9031 TaxID=2184566 RepID=UPI000F5E3717|nr:LysR family transcriptional regulator [Burkholderia sp. Bp9031]RQZ19726.1 LysR family transcriptional regulator [Burkholderia sp. Bp9031]
MDRLKTLEILKTVAEHGSFTKAAEVHRLGVATVSRVIRNLETSFGVLLFHRTTRRVTLTGAGHDVLEQADALLHQYNSFSVCCHSNASEIQGEISIEVSNLFESDRLTPVLADFSRDYPHVWIRVAWADHADAIINGAADLSIVTGPTSSLTCIKRPLGQIPMGLYASQRYLDACGSPEDPQMLERIDTRYRRLSSGGSVWSLQDRNTGITTEIRVQSAIRSSCIGTLMQATRHGAGIAVLPERLAQPHERTGELVRVLPNWQVADLDASLLYHSRRNLPVRIRKLTDRLVDAFHSTPNTRRAPASTADVATRSHIDRRHTAIADSEMAT